ncbi:MAG: helix-turn-helix domain-containing protein, partial [bacterium]|nr:helix-turn-helix domain-containing protein [bacterium]
HFHVHLPPLREKTKSIPSLARHFIGEYAKKLKRDAPAISEEVLDLLTDYHWPGNVRELQHAIERAVVVTDNHRLIPEDLPADILGKDESPILKKIGECKGLDEIEKEYIFKVYRGTNANKTMTARLLKIERNKLYRLMKRYEIGEYSAAV